MKTTARGLCCCALLLMSLLLGPIAVAQSTAQSLQTKLVGHWQLVSVSVNGGQPYGASPQGSMFIDAAGHFSVIVISGGGARSIAYFGTYTVSEADSSMTMHIDGSTGGGGESAQGRALKRLVALNGNALTVSNAMPSGAPGGIRLTWNRAD
jgi:hypothetical protein